jgi:hypothetical protein
VEAEILNNCFHTGVDADHQGYALRCKCSRVRSDDGEDQADQKQDCVAHGFPPWKAWQR